jgi:hypothetical protein
MGVSFEPMEVNENRLRLVIPFDRPVQAAACSIVGQAVVPGLANGSREWRPMKGSARTRNLASRLLDSGLALTRAPE